MADEYVRLTLAVQRHDPRYVDSYFGPKLWQENARRGKPIALFTLIRSADKLLGNVQTLGPSARRAFLEKQIVALQAFLRLRSGERMTWAEEARLLYDIEAERSKAKEYEVARERLQHLLPGRGELATRVLSYLNEFRAPPGRLHEVVRTCINALRERTTTLTPVPTDGNLRISYVRKKPWGAYHSYHGNCRGQISINLDFPIHLYGLFTMLAHEAYPGHHTYLSSQEHFLVKARSWREFSVHALFTPQTLVSEGMATVGLSVIMTPEERQCFLEENLAPLASIRRRDFQTYMKVWDAVGNMNGVAAEAARLLLQERMKDEEVLSFMARYGFARKQSLWSLRFFRNYRTYIYSYSEGERLVRAFIGNGHKCQSRYFDLLRRPVTPSQIRKFL